jgi:hypothetical protein
MADFDDTVMLVAIDRGGCTDIFSGEENTTGIALVGIYEVGGKLIPPRKYLF